MSFNLNKLKSFFRPQEKDFRAKQLAKDIILQEQFSTAEFLYSLEQKLLTVEKQSEYDAIQIVMEKLKSCTETKSYTQKEIKAIMNTAKVRAKLLNARGENGYEPSSNSQLQFSHRELIVRIELTARQSNLNSIDRQKLIDYAKKLREQNIPAMYSRQDVEFILKNLLMEGEIKL